MENRKELAKVLHELGVMYSFPIGNSPEDEDLLWICEKVLMDYDITKARGIKSLDIIRS